MESKFKIGDRVRARHLGKRLPSVGYIKEVYRSPYFDSQEQGYMCVFPEETLPLFTSEIIHASMIQEDWYESVS